MYLYGSTNISAPNTDVVTFISDGDAWSVSRGTFGLAGNWNQVEFNIFGDACGSDVDINGLVNVKITINNPTDGSPTPIFMGSVSGQTLETNTMNLVPGSLCPHRGFGMTNGQGALDEPWLEFLENDFHASPPSAPFCLLNDISALDN